MGDLNAPLMGGVVLASATAWVVLRLSLGDLSLIHISGDHSRSEYADGARAAHRHRYICPPCCRWILPRGQ